MHTVIETPIFQRMVKDVMGELELAKFDNLPNSVLKMWKEAYDG